MKKKKSPLPAILLALLAVVVILAAVLVIRTATYPFAKTPSQSHVQPVRHHPTVRSLERLAGGIRIPTVSSEVDRETDNPFIRFKEYLRESYPVVYARMDTLTINKYGLLFHWKGSDPSLEPILFCSHYDVVPVVGYEPVSTPADSVIFQPNDTPAPPLDHFSTRWDYPPFSGDVVEGRVYGRGTLDMKGMLFGIMEAADTLLKEGFTPQRDIWFAFGFDEEIGGTEGALKIAEYFREKGLSFAAVYDEGGIVAAPGLGGISIPMALVGTAEKGFCTIRIDVRGTGGHSSMPPAKGSLVQAAEIIEKLNTHQIPALMTTPVSAFLKNVGGTMGYASRLAIANQWLLGGVLTRKLSETPATNALIRTTTAVTMAKGSDAANVLSSVSEIVVNFRILPGETVADVENHVKNICEGYDTDITVLSAREPSKTSGTDTRGFQMIRESISRLYPDARVTPYLTIGGTDAYKYQTVSNDIYRFMPVYLNEYEQRTIHNENEFISLENFGNMIEHFRYIMAGF